MRFGGHQTFSIREGWLYKGLRLLRESPDLFATDLLQDHLGVGKNMAKAIRHWLIATRLASPSGRKRSSPLEITEFGELIWHHDRYMEAPSSWWMVHLQLAHNPKDAFSWNWFFNRFTATRFERAVVVDGLRRHLQLIGGRMPSLRTLERDVACLLRSYAEVIPREQADPEDLLECPMVELGLMTRSRQSGFFQLDRSIKPIPFPVFGYCAARAFALTDERDVVDLSLTELSHHDGSPGRLFSMSSEALYELIIEYQEKEGDRIDLSNQAGERIVRIRNQPLRDWMEESLASASESLVLAQAR